MNDINKVQLSVPNDPDKKFFLVFTNIFNYFTYEQLIQGTNYVPLPDSKLIGIPSYIPNWLNRPVLYWKYLPKYF
jgi:hypothetical protein